MQSDAIIDIVSLFMCIELAVKTSAHDFEAEGARCAASQKTCLRVRGQHLFPCFLRATYFVFRLSLAGGHLPAPSVFNVLYSFDIFYNFISFLINFCNYTYYIY